MSENKALIEQVGDFAHLLRAFQKCSKGKRKKACYRKFLFPYGEKLKAIEEEIKGSGNFQWGAYQEFYVHDPKKRLVMSPLFRDRIVHTALYLIMEPFVDPLLGSRTYACRLGMGNQKAAMRLQRQLAAMGEKRYCIKLDVKKYFASIDHALLFKNIMKILPDQSLGKILWGLLKSHDHYARMGRGIPIGNLTSQTFANFYLSPLDQKVCTLLGIDFFEDRQEKEAGYIRYMDDLVILADNKEKAIRVATALVEIGKRELSLEIPDYKYVVLANNPVPFLGYVLDENGHRPLKRNERKFARKIKRLKEKGYNLAYRAQVIQSYEAWQKLPLPFMKLEV